MEIVLLAAVIGAIALVRSKLRGDGGPDLGWAPGGAPTTSEPPRRQPGSSADVVRALSRVESRKLTSGFPFALGVVFSLMIVVVFGIIWSADFGERWENIAILAPIFAYPLVGMTIVGVHAAVTRERRDGAEELFRSCPVPRGVRTVAHLGTAWVPMLATAGFLGVFWSASVWRGSGFGSIPLRSAGDVLAALALALGGTCLGVALARWAPWWPAPIVAIIAVAAASTAISAIGEPGPWSQTRQLSTFPRYPDYDPVFAVRPVWWHLAWLLALTAGVAVIAVAHDRRDRRVLGVGAAAAVAVLLTGYATSRPLDAQEAELVASMVAHPERHQACIERAGSAFCTYQGFEELGEIVAEELEPVLAGMPTGAPKRLVVRQEYERSLDELDPEVRSRLPKHLPDLDADLHLGFRSGPGTITAARIATGLWAVGLPAKVGPTTSMESIAGEAPGVVALWIAARGLGHDDALDLASAHPAQRSDGSTDPLASGMPWPEPCDVGTSPVIWAPQDLTAARALLGLPEAEVRAVLDDEWATLTNRSTTTAQLLERFGLPPVGAIQDLGQGSWECTY